MTAPTIGAGVATTGFGADVVPDLPSHTAGDLLVAYGGWNGPAGTTGATAGWTQLFADTPTPSHWGYWKIATGSSEALTVHGNDAENWAAETCKVTGYDTSGPFHAVAHGGTDAGLNPIVPSVTAADAKDRVWLEGFLHCADSPPGTPTVPTGHTLIGIASDDFRVAALAKKTHLVIGATGSAMWTYSTGNSWRSFSALINPAPTGGGSAIAAIAGYLSAQD